jgi:hypothetical protein
LELYTEFFKGLSIIHVIVLGRFWLKMNGRDSAEINWGEYEHINDSMFNPYFSIRILQILQSIMGLFALVLLIKTVPFKETICSNDIGYDLNFDYNLIYYELIIFLPMILISTPVYWYIIKKILAFLLISFGPRWLAMRILGDSDNDINSRAVYSPRNAVLENVVISQNHVSLPPPIVTQNWVEPKVPDRIFTGDSAECAICYENVCNVLECGHLLCCDCQRLLHNPRKPLLCPVCRKILRVSMTYSEYKLAKEKEDNQKINNELTIIMNDMLNRIV